TGTTPVRKRSGTRRGPRASPTSALPSPSPPTWRRTPRSASNEAGPARRSPGRAGPGRERQRRGRALGRPPPLPERDPLPEQRVDDQKKVGDREHPVSEQHAVGEEPGRCGELASEEPPGDPLARARQ